MKVLYDISPLGVGYRSKIWQTGISRVVENVALGLIHSPDCELWFSVSESFAYLADAIAYVQSHPSLQNVPIPYAELITQFAHLKSSLYHQIDQLTTLIQLKSGLISMGAKLLRRLLTSGYQGLSLLDHLLLSMSLNQGLSHHADIFHSTFFAFPDLTYNKSSKRFLTVYDLIPILYPHLFSDENQHILRSILQQLTPEDWIICISHSTKKDLLSYRPDLQSDHIFVTHLAATADIFYACQDSNTLAQVRQKYSIPNVPYILSLSTLEPRKNISHTIRCFSQLVQQEKLKDLFLVIVGEKGWKYDAIFAAIPEFLHRQIIFTGYVANEDLAALYSGALVFVYPSLYEGFGLPPLEAMQCGTPVITSNTSSLPEVVGDAGIMVSPTDESALCQELLKLYQDPSQRDILSARSLHQAAKFSWERCTAETISAYKTALAV